MTANEKNTGDFWIKVRGEGDCYIKQIYQKAILRYKSDTDVQNKPKTIVNYNDTYGTGLVSATTLAEIEESKLKVFYLNYLAIKKL